jgi:hypothetical protein
MLPRASLAYAADVLRFDDVFLDLNTGRHKVTTGRGVLNSLRILKMMSGSEMYLMTKDPELNPTEL